MQFEDVIFWSTIAFAFGGVEARRRWARDQDARRTIPRAVVARRSSSRFCI
jgi:hypothetical protein